jgi:predicted transcriptional regulator
VTKIYIEKSVIVGNCLVFQSVIAVVKLNKVDELVVSAFEGSEKGLTLKEIAEKTGQTEKKVFKVLRKLFQNELIDSEGHQYRLAKA